MPAARPPPWSRARGPPASATARPGRGPSAGPGNGAPGSWSLQSTRADGSYWWRVRAVDAAGHVGAWSTIRALTIARSSSITVSISTLGFSAGVRDSAAPLDLDFGLVAP